MATVPDTSALTTSSQVFTTYTLPQIRTIHKSLHAQIDEKAARLRTQVGNSYRELLGTADTIVQMRDQMVDVQEVLGRMGERCGHDAVDAKVEGMANFLALGAGGDEDGERTRSYDGSDAGLGRATRLRLLEACCSVVGRLLKKGRGGSEDGAKTRGDRLVLAARVLVLGRLLVASFGGLKDKDGELYEAVETAKKNLRSLKRRLSLGIQRTLEKSEDGDSRAEILKALCAHSLSTSSGAKDALCGFLKVRARAIVLQFEVENHGQGMDVENVLKGIDLHTRTMLDVQALVPLKLADALASLKKKPLLNDESVKSIEGLRLDIYERWCGDEIQLYTPFIRHDNLDGKQARELLAGFAEKGSGTVLSGLKATLAHMVEFKAIVDLRTRVLQRWVRDGGKAKGFDPSTMLGDLRSVINDRLLSVIDAKVSKLHLVGSEVAGTLENWQRGTTDRYQSLWDDDMLDMEISEDSKQFTHEIMSRLHGRNDAVSRAITGYESWFHLIDDVGEMVERLRKQRWDNDVDEIEDEETIETRQSLLSKDDPQAIHDRLESSLDQAFKQLDEQFGSLWTSYSQSSNNGPIAMYLLRVLRDIRSQLPKLGSTETFGLGSVPSLHARLAVEVAVAPVDEFSKTALKRKRVAGRALWEGEPPLPSQPSPDTFGLLKNLVTAMGDVGLDLWTPTAVQILKQVFRAQLCDAWHTQLEEMKTPEKGEEAENSEEPAGDEEEKGAKKEEEQEGDNKDAKSLETTEIVEADDEHRQDLLNQWCFDLLLLQVCLGTGASSLDGDLEKLTKKVFAKTGLPNEVMEGMNMSAQAYWKRISLLFGLIA